MAGIISESYVSRPFKLGGDAARELVFDIQGTEDETEVQTLLLSAAPGSYLGRVIESIEAEPIGAGIWKGHARYVRLVDESEYTFSTGGGTSKITQSLATINAYAPSGETPPDFQGAIGVSEDSVEDVDISTPNFEFSETHRFTDLAVDEAYRLALFNLTGMVNGGTFRGLAAGECLFLGADGSKRGDELWSITFRFAGSPNETGISVGDISGIDKKGWEYLWVRYADKEDSSAFHLVKRPAAAYVEQVYPIGDFSVLGI